MPILLKEVRAQKQITQREVAERMNVHPNWVSGIETGRLHNVTLKTVSRLAKALGCSMWDLIPEHMDYETSMLPLSGPVLTGESTSG